MKDLGCRFEEKCILLKPPSQKTSKSVILQNFKSPYKWVFGKSSKVKHTGATKIYIFHLFNIPHFTSFYKLLIKLA